MRKFIVLAIFGAAGLAACANGGANYTPITDGPKGISFDTDLAACQGVAKQRAYLNDDTKTKALIGAGIGAIAGLADDEVSDTEGVIAGAVVGAVAGGGAGAMGTRDDRRQIVIECMKGRGHAVVG